MADSRRAVFGGIARLEVARRGHRTAALKARVLWPVARKLPTGEQFLVAAQLRVRYSENGKSYY
jgi:hypothetical protein